MSEANRKEMRVPPIMILEILCWLKLSEILNYRLTHRAARNLIDKYMRYVLKNCVSCNVITNNVLNTLEDNFKYLGLVYNGYTDIIIAYMLRKAPRYKRILKFLYKKSDLKNRDLKIVTMMNSPHMIEFILNNEKKYSFSNNICTNHYLYQFILKSRKIFTKFEEIGCEDYNVLIYAIENNLKKLINLCFVKIKCLDFDKIKNKQTRYKGKLYYDSLIS